jgi:glutathionylspermidine synthase
VRSVVPTTEYAAYTRAWDRVAAAGRRHFNVDTWAAGRRYLSLTAVALTEAETAQLIEVTNRFTRLLDCAVDGILADPSWWPALAWPWAAIELARQEPPHPGGLASLYGRFDCLLDSTDRWQVIEYNADTPSGGREASGLEPALARLFPALRPIEPRLVQRLPHALVDRIQRHHRPVRLVGVVSTHRWLEDLSQAVWLTAMLRRAGQPALVGDINDLSVLRGRVTLRGQPIDALYRFYPIERLYRHAIFGGLLEAVIDGRLLLFNGLRGFLAQSKACLAWLWANRARLAADDLAAVEQHLPPTLLARHPDAPALLPTGVVKHVNGREGDSVVFGRTLDPAGWQSRLLEDGYVVQQVVDSPAMVDVEVDDRRQQVRCVDDRYACVGGFSIGGRFAGCYTRLDGPITSARATYAVTLRERS